MLLFLSVGYLIFLAWRIASAGARIGFISPQTPLGFWNGLTLQIINPKAYVVATTLFSGFAFLPGDLALETVIKLSVINAVWIPVHLIWLGAGAKLHTLDLRPGTQRCINIIMALAMLAVVALALFAA